MMFGAKQLRGIAVLVLTLILTGGVAEARLLKIKPLPDRKLSRLDKEARKAYDEAMQAYDKINYPAMLESLSEAIDAEPDNIYLREMAVKVARHLGNITREKKAQDYYDVAIDNLEEILDSDSINSTQRKKVDTLRAYMVDMRNAVYDRDEMRKRHGMVFAEQVDKDRAEREAREKQREEEAKQKKLEAEKDKRGNKSPANNPMSGNRR